MANKVHFGLKNVYFAKMTDEANHTYATPVRINGGVSVTVAPVGDRGEFFADDILYYSTTSNQGYEGTLTVAKLPNEFWKDILGATVDTNGAILEKATDKASNFALGFEVDGDEHGRRVWFYNCSATRPNGDANTKENGLAVDTVALDIRMMPRTDDYKTKVTMELNEANTTQFNGWFSTVYEG